MVEPTSEERRGRRNLILVWVLVGLIGASVFVAVPAFLSTAHAEQVGPNVMGLNCDNDVDLATAVSDGEPCAFNNGLSGAFSAVVVITGLAGLGVIAVRRQPTNPTGLLLVLLALTEPWIALSEYVADWTLVRGEAPEWLGMTVLMLASPAIPLSFLGIALFLMLFPTGDFLNRWWRWVAFAVAGSAVIVLASGIFHPGLFSSDLSEIRIYYAPGVVNPLALDAIPADVYDAVFGVAILPLVGGMLAGVLSLIHRFWKSSGVERQQLKVVAFGVGSFAVFAVVMANLNPLGGVFSWIWDNLVIFLILFVFPAFAVALLKYRLYDVDVVINKTLVYGSLVALIAVMFGVIAFLPFLLVGAGEFEASGQLVLPFIATLAAVVIFQPARNRLQKLANRVVYGRRATPYEALSRFSAGVVESTADEQLLETMASILAEGTGAADARVWVVRDGFLRTAASSVPTDRAIELRMEGDRLPEMDGFEVVAPVIHKGDLLGALTVVKSPGEAVRPIENRLVEDLALQAGVVLRNFRLTEELRGRLDQLQASRQRLVAAQDDERRKLERDLHDGAQQQLVALKIKLGLLASIEDPKRRQLILEQLKDDADDAIQGLRDLARGIYPPMLAEEGLVKALRSQASKAALPIEVESAGVGRYEAEVEAAVYFCTLEALQNVAKYANADRASVILSDGDGALKFEITDDGVGFDHASIRRGSGLQNIEDRVEALGGEVDVRSRPGYGTTVAGWVPTDRGRRLGRRAS